MSLSQEEKDLILAIKGPPPTAVSITLLELGKAWDEHVAGHAVTHARESSIFRKLCKALGLSK